MPSGEGVLVEPRLPVEIDFTSEPGPTLFTEDRAAASELRRFLSRAKRGTLVFPSAFQGQKKLVARFLAKVALEAMALRLSHCPGYQEFLVNEQQFDNIRRFARVGDNFPEWPFFERRIYPEDQLFQEGHSTEAYQVMHEFDFLYTSKCGLYFVMAIFGIELSINLGGPEIKGYQEWLK